METSVGPDRAVTQLVVHLARSGVRTEIWHLDPAHDAVRDRSIGGIRVFELPARSRPSDVVRGLRPETQAFVERRRDDVDVLHLHSVFTPHNVWIARASAKPYVVSPRGGYSAAVLAGRHRWIKAGWMRFYESRFLRDAAAIHAVSEPERERLVDLTAHPHVVYIPNAIDPPRRTRGPGARSDGVKEILFIGRLAVQQKGLDLLLEGFARFLQSGGKGVRLVIAGSDFRGGLAEVERLSRALSIIEHITLRGPVYGEDKEAQLLGSHWFVHTSRWEGLPFAVLEALAAGRPVLVTPETNLGHPVKEYGAGFVVPGTPDGIAVGLHRLADCDSASYHRMGEGAGRLASEEFSWPEVTRQMIDLYHQIGDRPSSRTP